MSRSYRNYIYAPIATGNNGPWYKMRRRKFRRTENNKLRSIFAHEDIEDASDLTNDPKLPKKDTWREPTDGGNLVYNGMSRVNKWCDVEWLMNRYKKFLKDKHDKYEHPVVKYTDQEVKI